MAETVDFGEPLAEDDADPHRRRGRRGQRRQRARAASPARTGRLAAVDLETDSGDRRRFEKADGRLPHPGTRPYPTGCRAVGWSVLYRIGWRIAVIGLVLAAALTGALPISVRVIVLVGAPLFWGTLHLLGRPWVSTRSAVHDFHAGLRRAALNPLLNRCARRYLLREELDEPARRLLDRVLAAMADARASALAADGVIDADAMATVFAEQRWALAEDLVRQSRIRRRLDRVPASSGDRTAAVVCDQRAAVEKAQAASTAQVEALEDYADQVLAADLAYLDELHARDLTATNGDACLDLRAGIAGTAVRAAGLERLVDQIRAVTDAISAERLALQQH